MKEKVIHKDFFDNEVEIGDFVTFPSRNTLILGRILSVHPKQVCVESRESSPSKYYIYSKESVKADQDDVLVFIMKKQ